MKNIDKILSGSLLHGLILGLGLSVFSLLIWVFEIQIFSLTFGIVSFVIILGGEIFYTVWADKKYRTSIGGKTNFGELFVYGFILLLVAGIISAISSYLIYNVLDPDYLPRQVEHFYDYMSNLINDDEVLEQSMEKMNESMEKMQNLGRSMATVWIGPLILSLIIALVVKKDVTEN